MKYIKKINNTKQSRYWWFLSGFYKVLDGLIQFLSLGNYLGNFNFNHIKNFRK